MHSIPRHLALLLLALLVSCAMSAGAAPFTFVHVSDVHITGAGSHVDNLTAIAAEVNSMNPRPAFVLVTGDQTETGLPRDMDKYREVVTAFKMPVYNVSGNHETKWSNWSKMTIPKLLGQNSHPSFDYEGMHFIGLDSTMWMQHHGLIDPSQLAWMKSELEKVGRDTPTVLFYHHCPGFIPNESELLRAIKPYNVRLILTGHGHNYKTWKKNGVWFQEVRGAMNSESGYRILEVTDKEIRSYQKLVGKEKTADGVISLMPSASPVSLLRPKRDEIIEGAPKLRALITGEGTTECAVDSASQPITPDGQGVCEIAPDFQGVPGWHNIIAKLTDAEGMEWSDTVPVRINGASREAWRARVSGGVQRPVRVFGDRAYFGTLGGGVYCLDARTGRQVWHQDVGADVVSEVVVDGNRAYFGATDGRIIAMDAATGKIQWEYSTGGPIQASPVVANGRVFIGSSEPAFYALDAASGKVCWKYGMERMTQVRPIYMDGALFFGAWDKTFYALNASDGSVRWKTPIGVSFYYSTANSYPATDGRYIVSGVTPYQAEDPDIYCMDAKSGQIAWKVRNPGIKSSCSWSSPAVSGDRFYITTANGDLFCMKIADGKEVWRASTGQIIIDNIPLIANGKVYCTTLRGNIYCFDENTGKQEWGYSTGGGYLMGSATAWKDLVLVPSTDGTVTALYR